MSRGPFLCYIIVCNLIRSFLHDDTLQWLGSLHASLIVLCHNNNRIYGEDLVLFKTHSGLDCCSFEGGGSVVVDSLLSVTPIVGFCDCSMFCYALLCVSSSFATILIGKKELVALLSSSSCFLVIVV